MTVLSFAPRKHSAGWPDRDPAPEVRNIDVRPADAPEEPPLMVKLRLIAEEAGWPCRSGYSRARVRGQETGTFYTLESWGLWSGAHPSGWRFVAIYGRRADTDQTWTYYPESGRYVETSPASGEPGKWAWKSIAIFSGSARHSVLITDLRSFLQVRGSVLPSWFASIVQREAEKKEKQRASAKSRPKKTREGA